MSEGVRLFLGARLWNGRNLDVRRGDTQLLIILILTCFCLTWLLTRVYVFTTVQQPQLSLPSFMPGEATVPFLHLQTLDAEAFLPTETILVQSFEADLDNDGRPEAVLIFTDEDDPYRPGASGITIVARDGHEYRKTWEARPSSEGRVANAVVRDINMDGTLEILIFKGTEGEAKHSLHIFAWNGKEYASLRPRGGPLAGQEAFVSAYYPPEMRSLDSIDPDEIIVFEDEGSSERLDAIIYRWDGAAYTYVDWIIVLGPPRPSAEAAR